MVGQTLEVLVEGPGRKGNLQGRTRTNKLVHFEGGVDAGSFADVTVTGAHPHHLDGVLVPDLAEAAPASP
jgi:tRNA A37 methylthiotransferase MiaB